MQALSPYCRLAIRRQLFVSGNLILTGCSFHLADIVRRCSSREDCRGHSKWKLTRTEQGHPDPFRSHERVKLPVVARFKHLVQRSFEIDLMANVEVDSNFTSHVELAGSVRAGLKPSIKYGSMFIDLKCSTQFSCDDRYYAKLSTVCRSLTRAIDGNEVRSMLC